MTDLWPFHCLGAADYESDNSLHTTDHIVNGNVYDDDNTYDYYEPSHHSDTADVQVTPQKRRG